MFGGNVRPVGLSNDTVMGKGGTAWRKMTKTPKEGAEDAELAGLRLLTQLDDKYAKNGTLKDLVMDAAADDIEWWAAGPPDILPWADSFRGKAAFENWFAVLEKALNYEKRERYETVAQGNTVVGFIHAGGHARTTGRLCQSDIVRVWSFRGGKLARVRSFYDTAAYVTAYRS